ncbi:MAG: hypothetical protein D3903_22445 [Candidatus Electrothrix sp. GM3_4]|nr:hypothetical protein [Candidatus Electrothrix sp. GM3_4]
MLPILCVKQPNPKKGHSTYLRPFPFLGNQNVAILLNASIPENTRRPKKTAVKIQPAKNRGILSVPPLLPFIYDLPKGRQ